MIKEIQLKIWYHKAFNSLIQGDYERTEKYFSKIERKFPGRVGNSYNMGLVKLAQKEYETAEEYFLEECEKYGYTVTRNRTLGDLYYIWGKADKAKARYTEALKEVEKPEQKRLLQERIAKCSSENSFSRVMQSHSKYEEGISFQKEGETEKAKESYQKALELDSTNFQAANNLGSILLNEDGEPGEALQYFEKATLYSDLPGITQNIGRTRALMKQKEARSV
ncbi:tetratricopeptide repeat protein [Marispirochaeta aestuarii]|uniref:tetratricopeptide repeat protein n=1 Tax=Marispirochaeta aestuarii TaxID=1963862 RepID=UPI0029C61D34|nr:tetratricopeptide repeat protein [Marispirochaeta aestuarii]